MNKKNLIVLSILVVVSIAAAALYAFYRDKNSSPEYPKIILDKESIIVSIDATDEELLKGVTATDPEDGDVTSSLVVEGVPSIIDGNRMKITYAAFDSKNHVTKASRTVKYKDYVKPHFTLSAPLIFTDVDNVDVLRFVGAEDVFDGDISGRVKYSFINGEALEETEEYEIKFSVTNKIGDTATLPLTIEADKEYTNSDKITLTDYLVYIDKGNEFNAADYLESYKVGGEKITSAKGLAITSDVDTDEEGIYTVDYVRTKSKSRTRLVVVVE